MRSLLKSDVTRRDHVSVVMDAGSRIVNFIVNFIRDGTVFAYRYNSNQMNPVGQIRSEDGKGIIAIKSRDFSLFRTVVLNLYFIFLYFATIKIGNFHYYSTIRVTYIHWRS